MRDEAEGREECRAYRGDLAVRRVLDRAIESGTQRQATYDGRVHVIDVKVQKRRVACCTGRAAGAGAGRSQGQGMRMQRRESGKDTCLLP